MKERNSFFSSFEESYDYDKYFFFLVSQLISFAPIEVFTLQLQQESFDNVLSTRRKDCPETEPGNL